MLAHVYDGQANADSANDKLFVYAIPAAFKLRPARAVIQYPSGALFVIALSIAMPGFHEYLLFIAAGLLLNVAPGADMLYVITSATRYGIQRGIAGAFGVFAGTLVHIALAVAGLSAMLAASALAFSIVAYAGAAYLVYLGLNLLFSKAPPRPTVSSADPSAASRPKVIKIFQRGALINLLNPKIVLFFLAFLPQFIDPAAGQRTLAFVLLGLTFNVTGTTINCLAAISAAGVGRLPLARRIGGWVRRGVGVFFIGLGARLASSG